MKFSEVIHFKISPELRAAVHAKADRLGVRPIDVIRWAVAEAVADTSSPTVVNGKTAEPEVMNDGTE